VDEITSKKDSLVLRNVLAPRDTDRRHLGIIAWSECFEYEESSKAVIKRRTSMKVKDLMMRTPYYCQLDTNLGSAAELMWVGNCGFLPVMGTNGKMVGVVTDRDICIALGTRNCLAGEVTVREAMSNRLFACSPDDDVHIALERMKEGGVRRLPVIVENGTLVGVVSMDDLLLRAEAEGIGKRPELSIEEVVKTYRAIDQRRIPQIVLARGAA
jgi:CBS domain-containing protein